MKQGVPQSAVPPWRAGAAGDSEVLSAYWCIQVDKCSVSLVFISPQTSHSTFGTSCLCLIRSTSIFAGLLVRFCLWLQMKCGWMVTEVMNMDEN